MHATLLTLLTAATLGLPDAQYAHRIDAGADDRMARLHPHVRQAEINTDVPPRVLLGVIYVESNGHPWVRGDGGQSWGLGQVRCETWIGVLQPSPMHCENLLWAVWNVYATASILERLRDRYGGSWSDVARMYNEGPTARMSEGVASRYAEKVAYFGELFGRQYEMAQMVRSWRVKL